MGATTESLELPAQPSPMSGKDQTPKSSEIKRPILSEVFAESFPLPWTPPAIVPEESYLTSLVVRNSLSGCKVPFVPRDGKKVTWYGCGPTVYDAAHMGHARNYITFDILRRIMTDYFGYDVTLCMNITDIDDKIIARSMEQQVPFRQLARYWERDFFTDMKVLNVQLPDVVTRVSEYIPEVLSFIQKIIDNGFAYANQGSVYFDIDAFRLAKPHIYGRMEPTSVTDSARVLEGEGTLGVVCDKKSPLDFALWKKAKMGEPSWPSPWGEGRPGWHIECSAMASDIFGFPIDIHSGGIDLRFPHHDNEMAQSEAAYNQTQWVNYFLHSGHLHIKGAKMSKSLKNFITIKDILTQYSPRVLRLLTLLHRWDAPMNYSPDGSSMTEPMELDRQLSNFFGNAMAVIRTQTYLPEQESSSSINPEGEEKNDDILEKKNKETIVEYTESAWSGLMQTQKWESAERDIEKCLYVLQSKVDQSLRNNFDTPSVMESISIFITAVNGYLSSRGTQCRGPLVKRCASYVFKIIQLFGLTNGSIEQLDYASALMGGESELMNHVMDELAEFRLKIRDEVRELMKGTGDVKVISSKILELSDALRNEKLANLGIKLEDVGEKEFVWKIVNKNELIREVARKKENEDEKRKHKEEAAKALAEQKARKEAEARIPPQDYFRVLKGDQFSEFDAEGLPTKSTDGNEISKSQKDKLKKILEKHKKVYEEQMKSIA